MLNNVITSLAVVITIYHLVSVFITIQEASAHYLTHISSLLLFTLLILLQEKKGKAFRFVTLFLLVLSLISMVYIRIESVRLEINFGFATNLDIVIGILALIAILGATWLAWGVVLPILCCVFMLYFYLGHYLPEALTHPPFEAEYVMSYLAMGISSGIFGYLVPISANFIFLFLILAGIFGCTKVLDMFFEIGKAVGNVVRGGPAFVSVVASTLFGMISGSSMSNVIFTGSFTIPAMKQSGFRSEHAAAIESAASTGGQIMPPIMGAAAFVMAASLDVPYVVIMAKAVLPALSYYILISVGVYLMCRRYNIAPVKEPVNYRLIWQVLPVFILPLALLIFLLVKRFSAMYSAGMTVIFLLIIIQIQKETRLSLQKILDGIRKGTAMGAYVAVLLSAVGVIAQTVITTGFGPKLSSFLMGLTDAQLLPILLMAMIISIILGVGVPTTAAYIMVVLVTVPILVDLEINVFAAHFFCFFFAIFSTLTPPVAVSSLAASKIAGAKWMTTSLQALRLAFIAWVIPYCLVLAPELMEFPYLTPIGLLKLFCLLASGVAFAIGSYGYSIDRLNLGERAVAIISFFSYLAYFVYEHWALVIIGTIGIILVIGFPFLRRRNRVNTTNRQ